MLCSICHREFHFGIEHNLNNCQRFDENYNDYKKYKSKLGDDPCPICNNLKKVDKKFCSPSCKSKNREKITWPSDEILSEMVWKTPTTKIAQLLGVSDKAVEKRIEKLGLSKPPRGYWQKMAPVLGIEPSIH